MHSTITKKLTSLFGVGRCLLSHFFLAFFTLCFALFSLFLLFFFTFFLFLFTFTSLLFFLLPGVLAKIARIKYQSALDNVWICKLNCNEVIVLIIKFETQSILLIFVDEAHCWAGVTEKNAISYATKRIKLDGSFSGVWTVCVAYV